MTEAETIHALGRLVGLTTGWNDEAVEAYAAELSRLDDPAALRAACDLIGRSWTEARRPPLALIVSTYHGQRQATPTRALQRGEPVPPERGITIAREHYRLEVERQGRTPDLRRFDRLIRSLSRGAE